MRIAFLLILSLFLHACSSTPLEDQPGFDGYPLRSATPEEEARLKRCHTAIFHAQQSVKKNTGRYTSKLSSLGVDGECNRLLVMVQTHSKGYLAIAKINQDKTTVRWLSDETGKIFEEQDEAPSPDSLNPNDSGEDSGFGFGF